MAEKHGIKETKEAIIAIVELGVLVAKISKDGIKADDLSTLVAAAEDEAFKATLKAGVEGADLIDDEIKDISLAEGIELAAILPQLVEKIKSIKAA